MGVFLLRQPAGLGFGLPVILVTIKLLEGLEVGQHEGRAPASGEQDEGAPVSRKGGRGCLAARSFASQKQECRSSASPSR